MTEAQDRARREEYERSLDGDLASYFAMIGDGFEKKVNLLAQVIRDVHHPSLGRYKERLLAGTIAQFLPRRYRVGTGFVAFPKRRTLAAVDPTNVDHLNLYDHDVSTQLDLLVYDAVDYPVIFKDHDFVVLRPEAVRAIIEVKGALKTDDVENTVSSFIDFSRKWQSCRALYEWFNNPNGIPGLKYPSLYLMGWQPYVSPDGKPGTDGRRLRETISQCYMNVSTEFDAMPLLEAAYLYRDCVVERLSKPEGGELVTGYWTRRGQLVRYDDDGTPRLAGDGTVAALLASIHVSLRTNFNFLLSYADQGGGSNVLPHDLGGFSELARGSTARAMLALRSGQPR